MKKTHFNRIAIIQSLPEDQLQTGKMLYEDIDTINNAYDLRLDLKFYKIKSKEDFLNLLLNLIQDVKESGLIPILHIEVHGNKKGFELSSGDFVTWKDLKKSLIELNIATRNNLFIVLAACYGAYLMEILLPTDRSPCWGLVGPKDETYGDVLLKSLRAFYTELLMTGNGGNAVKLLNAEVPDGVEGYYLTSAEIFFEKVFKKYYAVNYTKQGIKKRALNLYNNFKEINKHVPSISIFKKNLLIEKKKSFKKYKKIFFMIDLYPENKNRFRIEYKDLKIN